MNAQHPGLKKSRQRDAILAFLSPRKDHPTADTVYMGVRSQFPNISLGTVYRNLTLLSEMGVIQKIDMGGTLPDRFDPNPEPHYHFACTSCGCVDDIEIPYQSLVDQLAARHYGGTITGHRTFFHGLCRTCNHLAKNDSTK